MPIVVSLVFGEPVEPGAFHELVRGLGSERDAGEPALRVSRDDAQVWVYGPEGDSIEGDPENEAEIERRLGAPAQADVTLELTRSPRSPELAREIVEAASRRWNLIVDNDQGGLFTAAELRDHPPGPSIFWTWPWGWA